MNETTRKACNEIRFGHSLEDQVAGLDAKNDTLRDQRDVAVEAKEKAEVERDEARVDAAEWGKQAAEWMGKYNDKATEILRENCEICKEEQVLSERKMEKERDASHEGEQRARQCLEAWHKRATEVLDGTDVLPLDLRAYLSSQRQDIGNVLAALSSSSAPEAQKCGECDRYRTALDWIRDRLEGWTAVEEMRGNGPTNTSDLYRLMIADITRELGPTPPPRETTEEEIARDARTLYIAYRHHVDPSRPVWETKPYESRLNWHAVARAILASQEKEGTEYHRAPETRLRTAIEKVLPALTKEFQHLAVERNFDGGPVQESWIVKTLREALETK